MNHRPEKKHQDIEVGLIIVSVVVLLAFIVLMLVNAQGTLDAISKFFNLMISGLGPFFEVTAFVIFLVGLYFCFGKYGKIRLGDCKPEYSNFSYFAMMLLASLASAALYWSFVEWAFYFESPGLGMEVLSQEALELPVLPLGHGEPGDVHHYGRCHCLRRVYPQTSFLPDQCCVLCHAGRKSKTAAEDGHRKDH